MQKTGTKVPATVDEYLNQLPAEVKTTLEKVRRSIKAAAPKAEESISYQMPYYNYKGRLVYFAAFKNHCSFFVASHAVVKQFTNELKPYHVSGVTLHFPLNKPLPSSLIKKIVQAKMKENEIKWNNKNLVKNNHHH